MEVTTATVDADLSPSLSLLSPEENLCYSIPIFSVSRFTLVSLSPPHIPTAVGEATCGAARPTRIVPSESPGYEFYASTRVGYFIRVWIGCPRHASQTSCLIAWRWRRQSSAVLSIYEVFPCFKCPRSFHTRLEDGWRRGIVPGSMTQESRAPLKCSAKFLLLG